MDGEIHTDELASLLEDDEETVEVVDIRQPASFARGHIPDSENVPLPKLVDNVDELDTDADRIVTVCPHGESSVRAARLIASYEGVDDTPVQSLAEGLTSWRGPIETAPQSADDSPF